jgi:hypothetical protein
MSLDAFLPTKSAPVTPGQRDELLKVRWGAREVTLRSSDGGMVYVGATGEEGLILVVRRGTDGRFVARIEDRAMNNSWSCPVPKHNPKIAVSSLHREVKRLSRAGGLRG